MRFSQRRNIIFQKNMSPRMEDAPLRAWLRRMLHFGSKNKADAAKQKLSKQKQIVKTKTMAASALFGMHILRVRVHQEHEGATGVFRRSWREVGACRPPATLAPEPIAAKKAFDEQAKESGRKLAHHRFVQFCKEHADSLFCLLFI